MLYLLLLVTAGWLLYKYWMSAYSHWQNRGIPSVPGRFPWGSAKGLTEKVFQGHFFQKMYESETGPYVGMYFMRTPFLVVRDPAIIKVVLTKDFAHFRDRNGFTFLKEDVLSHNLFNLEGDAWKALRVKLSPTFTSGKLKGMFPLFINSAQLLDSLLQKQEDSTLDVKDIVGRFTTDTISSCAFGIEPNSMQRAGVDLGEIGNNVFKLNWKIRSGILFWRIFPPKGPDTIPFRLTTKEVEETLLKLIGDTVDYRKKNNIKRNDFLDLLIQLKDKGKIIDDNTANHEDDHTANSLEMTLELMAAQAYVFFLAGYETSSSVQSYCLYEMALNPDIQERVHKEIEATIAKHGDLTYQAIQEMDYLDMVVSETMRKYPTLPVLTRSCTQPITLPTGDRLYAGDKMMIPVWSLHHDPEYFPDPEKFDPERFTPENKQKIVPYSYLPFGEGPRICIGMRFGLLQTKVGLITILRRYKVSPSDKTVIPLKFRGSLLVASTVGPIYLKIEKIG